MGLLSAVMSRQGGTNGQSHLQHLVDRWEQKGTSSAPKGEETWASIQGAMGRDVGGSSTVLREADKGGKLDRLMTKCEVEVHRGDPYWLP